MSLKKLKSINYINVVAFSEQTNTTEMSSTTVVINGAEIPVEYPSNTNGPARLEAIMNAPKVKDWFKRVSPELLISKVTITGDTTFGKNVLFVHLNMTCIDRASGKSLAGIVFLRGSAVTCLVLIRDKSTGKLYYAKVKQPRVPVGKWIWELPAGMFELRADGEGKMAKTQMIVELKEELGIEIDTTGVKTDDPTQQFNYMEKLGVFYPSPGGCDEEITTYWFQVEMTTEEIAALHGKSIANDAGHCTEIIQVGIEELTVGNLVALGDAKAMCTLVQLVNKYPGFVPL